MTRFDSTHSLVAAIFLMAATTACSDTTGIRATHTASLSVTTKSASLAPAAGSFQVSPDIIIGTGTANVVKLTSAQLVLSHVELSSAGTCSTTTSHGDDDCDEIEVAPVLLDLPMDTTVRKAIDVQIPAGTYTRLQAELDALTSSKEETNAFVTAHPEFAGISVRVVGTYTDKAGVVHPFTYTSAVDAELEMAFPAPITVGPNTSNLTIAVDVASWFKASDGSVIDPTVPANAATIDANIVRSLRAFGDDDRDGHDDQGEHGNH